MARPSRLSIARWLATDLRIEPSRDDAPARLIVHVVGQDKNGRTLTTDSLDLDVKSNECPPAVRQAVGTIEGYVKAWAENG